MNIENKMLLPWLHQKSNQIRSKKKKEEYELGNDRTCKNPRGKTDNIRETLIGKYRGRFASSAKQMLGKILNCLNTFMYPTYFGYDISLQSMLYSLLL